jgi:hypothetical protein
VCAALVGPVVAFVALAAPASAAATTYCVHSPASCPAGAITESTIQDAVDASNSAGGSNRVLVGAGTFSDGFTNVTGASTIAIVGAGAGQTVLQSSADTLDDSGSSVSGVTIVVPNSPNAVGLTLTAGTVSNTAITDAGDSQTTLTGVEINGASTLTQSSITLADASDYGITLLGLLTGVTTVSDTTVDCSGTNSTGVESENPAETDLLRDRIIGAAPVSIFGGAGTTRIDDSLIEGAGSFDAITAQGGSTGTTSVLVDHDTLNGATSAAPGIAALPGTGGAVTVTVRNTIIETGGFTNLDVEPPTVGDPGTATLSISYSDYNPDQAYAPNSGTLTTGAGNVHVDPGFVSSGSDPFALSSSSALVDQGDSAGVESGETSTTDLLGAPRVIAGAGGGSCTTRSDIGAYELDPTTIATTATPSLTSVVAGKPVGFSATPCDPDPSQTPTVSWSFDDGGSATGTSVTHTFATPGKHKATVTVTDGTGRSGSASATVTVTTVSCSGASCRPSAPVIRLRPSSARLSRTRSIALTLTCIASAPCQGTLTLRAVVTRVSHHKRKRVTVKLATVRFTLAAGRGASVKVTVSRADATLIAKLHKLEATTTIVAHDGASASATHTARITLKPPKKRAHG